jgi:hypothetical protein
VKIRTCTAQDRARILRDGSGTSSPVPRNLSRPWGTSPTPRFLSGRRGPARIVDNAAVGTVPLVRCPRGPIGDKVTRRRPVNTGFPGLETKRSAGHDLSCAAESFEMIPRHGAWDRARGMGGPARIMKDGRGTGGAVRRNLSARFEEGTGGAAQHSGTPGRDKEMSAPGTAIRAPESSGIVPAEAAWPMVWWWRSHLPERKDQACRVLVRGARNSCLVEFPDGFQVVTSRWAVRRRKEAP